MRNFGQSEYLTTLPLTRMRRDLPDGQREGLCAWHRLARVRIHREQRCSLRTSADRGKRAHAD